MKAPGKRNYKTLFSNLKKVSLSEVMKASAMFKGMTQEYNKLKAIEKKVFKALEEKGLHLSTKDFNIMEVFNNAYSEYSFEATQQEKVSGENIKYSPIYIDRFEPHISKEKKEQRQIPVTPPQDKLEVPIPEAKNNIGSNCLEGSMFEPSGTPNSLTFEKISILSKYTGRSHRSFASKKSQRHLFQDYQVERRQKYKQNNQKGDYM